MIWLDPGESWGCGGLSAPIRSTPPLPGPPPHLRSCCSFLPPLCLTKFPQPDRPKSNITFSSKLSAASPSSECPPLGSWLCNKESGVLPVLHILVNHETWPCGGLLSASPTMPGTEEGCSPMRLREVSDSLGHLPSNPEKPAKLENYVH